MLTIGVDAHKRVHEAVALDAVGQERGRQRVPNSAAGWRDLLAWAAGLGEAEGPRRWGIEGAWGSGRGLAQHLVGEGETVYEVSPRWTAEARKSARRPGKSDALDALAVARLVLGEAATLPAVGAEDATAVLDLLTAERDAALADATRLRNQLHHLLLQLDPEYEAHLPALRTAAGVAALEGYAAPGPRALDQERAASVRRLAQRLRLAVDQAEALAAQIRVRAQAGFVALTRRCGVSLLTAGALAGILGPGRRFATDAQLAAYAGVAPLAASSAGRVRHRLNRGGTGGSTRSSLGSPSPRPVPRPRRKPTWPAAPPTARAAARRCAPSSGTWCARPERCCERRWSKPGGDGPTLKTTQTRCASTSTRRTRTRISSRWVVRSAPARRCRTVPANSSRRPTAKRSSASVTWSARSCSTCASRAATRCRSRPSRGTNSSLVSNPSA